MTKLHLSRIPAHEAPAVGGFADHTVFQSDQWLAFIAETQNAELVVARVEDGPEEVGRFTGLITRKSGLRLLGSPFPGWTTSYLGFNLIPSISRLDALLALERFAFRQLNCVHFEIMDRRLTVEDFAQAGFPHHLLPTYQVDLSQSTTALMNRFSAPCRRNIRRSAELGVRIEAAEDLAFADDYWNQLLDVFAKRNLVPTYSKDRVTSLIRHILPTGNLLLVRARDAEGNCLATGIFPAANDTMYFWGGASWRTGQHLRPNEAIQIFAMRYWQERGITLYDMGGGGAYKRKYGGQPIAVPWGRRSKYRLIETLRNCGRRAIRMRQQFLGYFKK